MPSPVCPKRINSEVREDVSREPTTVFTEDLPNPFQAIRYHSLLIERNSLPDCFEISAETEEREIMGVRHRRFAIEGIQFHPESIMTQAGKKLLKNFLELP